MADREPPPPILQLTPLNPAFHWAKLWREAVPGCDPQAAVEALRPVAALRNAAAYASFLANIEPNEHPYHAADVPFWLGEAQRIAGGE
jgi:hypothetical protein